MFKQQIETLMSEFAKLIPEDMQSMKHELEDNFRATLNASFSKLDLVTREEFDIQAALLQRSRARLDELQQQLEQIEQQLQEGN